MRLQITWNSLIVPKFLWIWEQHFSSIGYYLIYFFKILFRFSLVIYPQFTNLCFFWTAARNYLELIKNALWWIQDQNFCSISCYLFFLFFFQISFSFSFWNLKHVEWSSFISYRHEWLSMLYLSNAEQRNFSFCRHSICLISSLIFRGGYALNMIKFMKIYICRYFLVNLCLDIGTIWTT